MEEEGRASENQGLLDDAVVVAGALPGVELIHQSDDQLIDKQTGEKAFFDRLRAESRDYRRLCEEREKQEESVALQVAAEKRRSYFQEKESSLGGKPVTPSLAPYKNHYQKRLYKYLKTKKHGRFCDIGSSPGGMTSFLCRNLDMTGYAFSLDPEKGGFEMTFRAASKGSGSKEFLYNHCDMSEPDAWKTQLKDVVGDETFDFINLGVTLQWQNQTKEASDKEESEGGTLSEDESDENEEDENKEVQRDNRLTMQQIVRNEHLFALHCISDGGSLMTTLPNSDHPNTFLYLKYLVPCTRRSSVDNDDPSSQCKNKILMLPTPKVGRKPVYVLVQDIDVKGDGVQDFLQFLESTEATPENDAKWLVQSGDEEAAPSFDKCRKSLEFIWRLQLQHLKKERRQAEKDYYNLHQRGKR